MKYKSEPGGFNCEREQLVSGSDRPSLFVSCLCLGTSMHAQLFCGSCHVISNLEFLLLLSTVQYISRTQILVPHLVMRGYRIQECLDWRWVESVSIILKVVALHLTKGSRDCLICLGVNLRLISLFLAAERECLNASGVPGINIHVPCALFVQAALEW